MGLGLSTGSRYGLAFSGGTDSSLLLALMLDEGLDVVAYTVDSAFQAPFEAADARAVARSLGATHEVIGVDVLAHDEVCSNPPDRCYHCKRLIFSTLLDRMAEEGRDVLVDGTNASDDPARRPGFRALAELGVVSPLRDLGLTKDDVRRLSRERGLMTASKPSFSCLATHVGEGLPITAASLAAAAPAAEAETDVWVRSPERESMGDERRGDDGQE
ncbi:MAG: ATP-dependent sacrificial sulfur transferase LarE [Atopobiaceae bacterium]|nr:ATP-dependent sacrificial sulfur transferase LarE [Atopobiaceae bacterium]MCI2173521.1 ATP-dependent sacrificial sulfur transferase LarE [Atopobiaceae bacterium]MCI2207516.1 ATP-dependent sacrificial sulfur transferase LarE [Atopobiaceae bacterium]